MSDFDEIYREYAGAVFGVSLRAVSRPEVAEDITSEVFLAFRNQVDRVPREQVPAWLFAVAKRRAADYWRHHYVEQRWTETVLQESPQSTSAEPEYPLETLLRRCTELKPMHRKCLILRFRHGMTRAEIAEHLRTSEMQVKNHLQYGLKLLRDTFDVRSAPLRAQATDDREKGMNPAV